MTVFVSASHYLDRRSKMLRKTYSVLCVTALSCATAMAQRTWEFISFDPPGATATNADGINTNGDVVGWYMDSAGKQHGYVLRAGNFTTIDYAGASATIARAINDQGDIVGTHVGDPTLPGGDIH